MKAMFKPFIASISALSLAACAGIDVSGSVTAFETGVLADVAAACQVEPVIADIALLIPIYGTNAAAAAAAICASVANAPPAVSARMVLKSADGIRHGIGPVVVRGVTIHFQ